MQTYDTSKRQVFGTQTFGLYLRVSLLYDGHRHKEISSVGWYIACKQVGIGPDLYFIHSHMGKHGVAYM